MSIHLFSDANQNLQDEQKYARFNRRYGNSLVDGTYQPKTIVVGSGSKRKKKKRKDSKQESGSKPKKRERKESKQVSFFRENIIESLNLKLDSFTTIFFYIVGTFDSN